MKRVLTARQQRALARQVALAAMDIPFYAREWRSAGIDMRAFDPVSDFHRLPVITKDDLRRYPVEERMRRGFRPGALKRLTTSGSTGQPFEVFIDKRSLHARQWRTLAGIWHAGYRPGQRFLWLKRLRGAGDARSRLAQRLLRLSYINVLDDPEEVLRQYRAQRPDIVYGQLSALAALAQGVDAAGHPVPRTVISFGEQLAPSIRDGIRRGLGADLTDFYGNTEVGLIAVRRPDDTHYHTVGSDLLLEYLPAEGAPGFERLVVTSISAVATPFIRYDTGDLVRRDHSLPRHPIVAFAGKALDFITLPDGTRMGPYRIDEAIFATPGLKQYRIVQHADHTVELFLLCTGERRPSEVAADARAALHELCGPALVLKVSDYVESTGSPTMKLRLIESRVPDAPD